MSHATDTPEPTTPETPVGAGTSNRRTKFIVAGAASVTVACVLALVVAGAASGSTVATLPDGTTVEVSAPRTVEADEVPGTDELQPGESVAFDLVVVAGAEMQSYEFDIEVRHGASEEECDGAGVAYVLPEGGWEDLPDTYYAGETMADSTYYFECQAEPGDRLVVEVSNDSGSAVVVTEMP